MEGAEDKGGGGGGVAGGVETCLMSECTEQRWALAVVSAASKLGPLLVSLFLLHPTQPSSVTLNFPHLLSFQQAEAGVYPDLAVPLALVSELRWVLCPEVVGYCKDGNVFFHTLEHWLPMQAAKIFPQNHVL